MFVVPFIYTFVIQLEQYHVLPLSLEKPDVLLPQITHSVDKYILCSLGQRMSCFLNLRSPYFLTLFSAIRIQPYRLPLCPLPSNKANLKGL